MLIANTQRPVVDGRAKTHCVTFCSSPTRVNPAEEEATKIASITLTAMFPVISQ